MSAGRRSLGGGGQRDLRGSELKDDPEQWVAQADVIINATPVGQGNEPAVIPTDAISPVGGAGGPGLPAPVTPLIQAARDRGAIAHSGLGMLLHQAAISFEIWTGVEAPMEAMSAAGLWELAKTADATH